jgi:geranylgeranyl transferase type-2 subunit alpha
VKNRVFTDISSLMHHFYMRPRSALALDGRNFHAWNYRQFIVKLMGVHAEEELSYASSLIAADFSNYSAWHYRTMLLPRLYNEDITTGAHQSSQVCVCVCMQQLDTGY